jgi:hypothetical protein
MNLLQQGSCIIPIMYLIFAMGSLFEFQHQMAIIINLKVVSSFLTKFA